MYATFQRRSTINAYKRTDAETLLRARYAEQQVGLLLNYHNIKIPAVKGPMIYYDDIDDP